MDLLPNSTLYITNVPNWANYRWVVQPLYGQHMDASITYIHEADSYLADTNTRGVFDTGWVQDNASGYAQGDVIDAADVKSRQWYIDRSLPVPHTIKGPLSGLPFAIPLGWDCAGVQVTSFVYFGPNDAITQNLTFQTLDPGGLELLWIPGGYYVDTATGEIYRDIHHAPYTGGKFSIGSEKLSDICSRVAKRGGLDASDIDVTALGDTTVKGYPIARQANAADCLRPLLAAYFAFASEYDAKLRFRYYGDDAAIEIDRDDLIEGNDGNDGAIVSNLRNQATEFPRRIVATYIDPAQNYSAVQVADERRAEGVIAIGDQSFEIPVVMTADEATQATKKAMKVTYATLEGTLEYSTPFAGADVYLKLAAGEALTFQGKRYVMDNLVLGNGTLKLTTRYDRQSAYRSNAQAIIGNLPMVPSSPYSGPSALVVMNLPSLRPQDTYGVYLAAAGAYAGTEWRGCTVQVSYDGQASWQNAVQISESSVMGSIALAEPTGGEPLTVSVNGDLDSVTAEQIAANANAFAIVHADGAEIGQFQTATETTSGDYELTDVTRGGLGTTEVPAETGEPFVMLNAVYFLPIDVSFKGKTIYFRAVGFGDTAESAQVTSIVYNPDTTVIHDGGIYTP